MAGTSLDTVADYLTDARVLLQDEIVPFRYQDDSLLTALNLAILEGRRLRADLFLHTMDNLPQFQNNDDTPFNMEPQFRAAFLHGMVAHALERDQEDIQDERAAQFTRIFNAMLVGVASPGLASAKGGGGQ